MNLSKIEIIPHEEHENWFRVIFTSQKTAYGCTSIDIVCSAEALRHVRNQCNDALAEKLKAPHEESEILTKGRLRDFK